MGVSSDAMLYFGFQVGGDEEPPEWLGEDEDGERRDFEEFVCEKAGLATDAPYTERSKIVDACPADLHWFCSYDYPMFILGVRDAEHRVNRGYLKEIGPSDLAVPDEKIAAFKAWCLENNIEYQEPKWLLCSMYG
jgi:hypothetical protein